jgi:transcription-repair coupling factor (superfamily II helicase)
MNSLYKEDILSGIRSSPRFIELERAIAAGAPLPPLSGIDGPVVALLAALLASRNAATVALVYPTEREAETAVADLATFGFDCLRVPSWGTAAYRPVGLRSPAFAERAAALCALPTAGPSVVAMGLRAALAPTPAPEDLAHSSIPLKRGMGIDPESLADRLSRNGYLRVPRVTIRGEFALRGEVLDIYPATGDQAIRAVFEYDEIDKIARFDPVTQSTLGLAESVAVPPLKERTWDEAALDRLERWANREFGTAAHPIIEQLRERGEAEGEELFFPVAWDERSCALDFLAPGSIVIFHDRERMAAQDEALRREYEGLYRRAREEAEVPPPETQLLEFGELPSDTGRTISTYALSSGESRLSFGFEPPRSFFGNINYLREEIRTMSEGGYSVHVFAESDQQAERIGVLLSGYPATIHPSGISSGFVNRELSLMVVAEGEIFGRRKRVPRSVKSARSQVIDTFVELSEGDYVVHVNYGIGRFVGIERMRAMGNERDYVKIEYADEETVFVPIEQANLVQRYIGNEGESPRLDRIGSKSWESRKNRVRKAVEQLAERLIRIYARRKTSRGFAFPPDGEWQYQFEAAFPYEETKDQLQCIADVKADMESDRPMDRMICGDVGYGKTEIAMRACFKAVASGKQAAFLAPTTILAEQHFENLQDRLRDFPVRIAMLSRFVEPKERKKAIEGLKAGSIDLVVGTHRVLQKDVEFKDLGLLVIDEEQRFGVKDKERLKEVRATVDCLTLTATPIPRTLHMSLLKIRDMSVLTTPPRNRHPIHTVVDEFDEQAVAAAIRKEVARGGQVFYLHNRVQSLEDTRVYISNLVPEVLVETAHGQMDPEEIEDVMHRFVHNGFHVLVSTTIIENGIDIPNVNTIIIDRADMYGISQLYQLRGRVGRSDRVAYAYLFYPDGRALSELAMKRLQIISDFTELGSGFKIAMKDLEVRGAGNLLGREQSGDIYAVGFDLYLKLLEEAVAKMTESGEIEEEPYLELEYAGYIPDDYVSGPTVKMEIYKKIASIVNQDDLDALHAELEDRFGPLPEDVQSLLSLAEIRVLARRLSIASIKERKGVITLEFSKVSKVSVERLLALMRESSGRIKLDPERPNVLMVTAGQIGLKEKSEYLREKLAALAG